MTFINRSIHRVARLFAFIAPCLCHSLHAIPVRVLAWDEKIAALHLAIGDSKGSQVIEDLYPTKRTDAYQVVAGEEPPFIENLDFKNPEGKPSRIPISIPEGTKRPLLVVLPDEKAKAGLRLFVLEDDSSDFTWGSTRFINATGKPLVFSYDKKIVPIAATWHPVEVKPGSETHNMEVRFFFRDQPKRPFYSGIWEQNSEIRTLVFLIPGDDPRLGPVAMKMIPEDRRREEAEETTVKSPGANP